MDHPPRSPVSPARHPEQGSAATEQSDEGRGALGIGCGPDAMAHGGLGVGVLGGEASALPTGWSMDRIRSILTRARFNACGDC